MAFRAIMAHPAESHAFLGSLGRMALFAIIYAREKQRFFVNNARP
jgi:hypothetical protein